MDVSASMKEAFSLDRTVSGNVERTHAIITTLNGIVNKESVAHSHRQDRVFVSAFGLKDVNTCDLIHLLDYKGLINDDEPEGETDNERANVFERAANLSKLNQVRKDKEDPSHSNMTGHQVLIEFATKSGAPHAKRWIERSLTEAEAGVLYTILSRDKQLTKEFIEKLPDSNTTDFLNFTSTISGGILDVSDSKVKDSKAYKLAKKVIYRFSDVTIFLQNPEVQTPQIWPVKEVSDLLDKILKRNHNTASSEPSHSKSFPPYNQPNISNMFASPVNNSSFKYRHDILLQKARPASFYNTPSQKTQGASFHESSAKVKHLFDYLTPFIFGRTPMVESLEHAKCIFHQNQNKADKKILFILSDGLSTDGDPLPIAKVLQALDVIVVTCYLTTSEKKFPRQLMDKKSLNSDVDKGAAVLLKMSSSMHNTKAPVSYFVDAGWELPTSGQSNLYFQANSLVLVDEFCKILFRHMEKNTCADALVDIIAHVSVANYINVVNSKFEPKKQIGKTCYANAIAAVYHLAMSRIIGRQGGIPSFQEILAAIKTMFDEKIGGNTKFAMDQTCSKYHLHVDEVNEEGAREAINKRRPVVATFKFINKQQGQYFGNFFQKNPRGILKSGALAGLCTLQFMYICTF